MGNFRMKLFQDALPSRRGPGDGKPSGPRPFWTDTPKEAAQKEKRAMLYLRNAAYLHADDFTQSDGHFAVEEGPFGGIRPVSSIPAFNELAPGDRVLDCRGRFVTKALACGHHHIYSALARGMPPAPKAPTTFAEVLELIWWRLDKCLDNDTILASALAAGLHMAKNGVTFCIDHHASPFAVENSLSIIVEAFDRIGIGHLLCYETSCRDGHDIAEKGLAEHERFFASGGKGHVGLHASFTVDDAILAASVDLARKYDTGLHIHVAEAKSDQDHCLAIHGKTVIQRLKDAGALESAKTILGHCVHVSEEDKKILAASPCWIVQNVESNQINNVGLSGYSYNKNVMLGTDGMHSDMIRSAQAAYFAGIAVEGATCSGTYERLRNVHTHAALHGAPGAGDNNLIVLDYDTPTPLTTDNALGHFFYGLDAGHVATVVSQGKVIVEDRRLTTCDEAEILAFTREQSERLWAALR